MGRVFFLTSRLPYPPNRGDKVRTHMFLSMLQKEHEVIPISLYDDKDEEYLSTFRKLQPSAITIRHPRSLVIRNLLGALLRTLPFQVAYYHNPELIRLLNSLKLTKEDTVLIHMIRMEPYQRYLKNARCIIDMCDSIAMEYQRSLPFRKGIMKLFFWLESYRTVAFERKLLCSGTETWFISANDLASIANKSSHNAFIIPNAVRQYEKEFPSQLKKRIAFLGNMSVPHNIHTATTVHQKIMPELLKRIPDLTFDVIGANPVSEVQAMDGINNTRVIGFVEDLYDTMQQYDLFIAPMYFNAGVQNKILESFAAGLPVITTSNVAAGIGCEAGKHYLNAETSSEFVERALLLLRDEVLRKDVSLSAKSYINEYFSVVRVESLLRERLQ